MNTVISRDGTRIAYEKAGSGPPVILVDGAMCSRRFGPMPALAPRMASHFTVYWYDRRGRGDSTDTAPHDAQREVEDLAALLEVTGPGTHLLGLSSGAGLALRAAAAGLPVGRVVAYEPPYVAEGGAPETQHAGALNALIAADQRGAAVEYFMMDMVKGPRFVLWMMKLMPGAWKKLKAVAHTLPYDVAVMGDFTVPRERLATIRVPALVMHGGKTTPQLKKAATVVAQSIPGALHREVPGQDHNINPAVLTRSVTEFLGARA